MIDRDQIFAAAKIIDAIVLSVLLITGSILVYSTKFRIDLSGMITLGIYLITYIFKVLVIFEVIKS
jgi:hypothetical protein